MKKWTDMSTKDLRKAAFVVGFGFVMGKKFADTVDRVTDRLLESIMRDLAKNGNEFAQKVCAKADVEYDNSKNHENETKDKNTIGFHA